MKKLLILGLACALSFNAFAGCQEDYRKATQGGILPGNISNVVGNALPIVSVTVTGTAAIVVGSATGALVIGLLAGNYLRDRPYHQTRRALDYAGWLVTGNFPQPGTHFREEVAVDGESKEVRKQQRRQNRRIRKANRRLRRSNKSLAKTIERSRVDFYKLLADVKKDGPNYLAGEFAQILHRDNEANLLCNSTVGTYFEEDMEYRHDRVSEDGETRRERRRQRRHNRRVRRHNDRIYKVKQKNRVASRRQVVRYYTEVTE